VERVKRALFGMGLLVACSAEPPQQVGLIAFSEEGTGALVIRDIAMDDDRIIDVAGPFDSISFSTHGALIAYANRNREVFVSDLSGGAIHSVGDTGSYIPALNWEPDDLLWYPTNASSSSVDTVLVARDFDVRIISGAARISGSPTGDLVAYLDCSDSASSSACAGEIQVERADGSGGSQLAAVAEASGVRFSPDGSQVLAAERWDGQLRIVARPIESGGVGLDLGPADRSLLEYGALRSLSLFSPNGLEVLSADQKGLVALSLDGGGGRSIAPLADSISWFAGFTPLDDVLVTFKINIDESQDDTPIVAYNNVVVSRSGDVTTLLEDDRYCNAARGTVSTDGTLLAYDCGKIQRVDDATLLRELSVGGRCIGFTPDNEAIYVVDEEILLVSTTSDRVETLARTVAAVTTDGTTAAYFAVPGN
jgi:hypothetical protein